MNQQPAVSDQGAGVSPAFAYAFSVWPDEKWGFDKAVFDLFRVLNGRTEMVFTPAEFERFRSGLSHAGLTLREITRVPQADPESVE